MNIEKILKKPIRTCVYTRIKDEKANLLRLVKNENGTYVLDINQKIQKRAIYISASEKTLKILEKNKKYDISEKDMSIIKEEILKRIKVGVSNG
ncbi:YlxR family protein [Oceanivirga salmonicida]|uniref:YlxR family protein n=1 Tax=Oceanivirga salmonicida TaxID=1769291 RepID=UPI00082FDF4D|nr:YlxR family protein [Oceanivirga salmonicida]